MEKNVFIKKVSDADYETLLLSSQIMLNELANRYLKSCKKVQKQGAPCHYCGRTSAIQFAICSDCRNGMDF